jgi:hypothetical protein
MGAVLVACAVLTDVHPVAAAVVADLAVSVGLEAVADMEAVAGVQRRHAMPMGAELVPTPMAAVLVVCAQHMVVPDQHKTNQSDNHAPKTCWSFAPIGS